MCDLISWVILPGIFFVDRMFGKKDFNMGTVKYNCEKIYCFDDFIGKMLKKKKKICIFAAFLPRIVKLGNAR